MIHIIDQGLGLDLFLKNKNFAFSFDKNNEVETAELVGFFNEHFFGEAPFELTTEDLQEAIESDRFSNMKAVVVESRVMIQELRGLGHDWVVVEASVETERRILEALEGECALTVRIQRQRHDRCRVRNL